MKSERETGGEKWTSYVFLLLLSKLHSNPGLEFPRASSRGCLCGCPAAHRNSLGSLFTGLTRPGSAFFCLGLPGSPLCLCVSIVAITVDASKSEQQSFSSGGDGKQQTANSKQQTTNSKQQTANNNGTETGPQQRKERTELPILSSSLSVRRKQGFLPRCIDCFPS
jgi:hypothetical protein